MNNRYFTMSALICGVLLACAEVPNALAQDRDAEEATSVALETPIKTPIKWECSGVLVRPVSDDTHKIVSVKDPTVVHYDGLWHIYATAYLDLRQDLEHGVPELQGLGRCTECQADIYRCQPEPERIPLCAAPVLFCAS